MDSDLSLPKSKINFFHTSEFLLIVVLLTMVNNLESSTSLYHQVTQHTFTSSWMEWIRCYAVNLIIDLSIIAFVVNGRRAEAFIYSLAVCIINLLSFGGINIFYLSDLAFGLRINQGIAKVVYSLMFTYSIYAFSEMYLRKIASRKIIEQDRAELEQVKADNLVLSNSIQQYLAVVDQVKEKLEQKSADFEQAKAAMEQDRVESQQKIADLQQTIEAMAQEKQRTICQGCKKDFETVKGLSAHKGRCTEYKSIQSV